MHDIDDELREQIKAQLENKKRNGTSVVDLAKGLDVQRATVYQLLIGQTTPTAKVLCNACRNLNMTFRLNGHLIAATDFPVVSTEPPTAIQLGLFDIVASSDGDEVNVTLLSKKQPQVSVEFGVRITELRKNLDTQTA